MIISPAKASDAANVLGIELQGLTADAISKAYRERAKDCHPDHHGNEKLQEWSRVSWARDCLGFWLEHHQPPHHEAEVEKGDCRACAGSGRVKVGTRTFGTPLTMACIVCNGLGSVIEDEDDHDG